MQSGKRARNRVWWRRLDKRLYNAICVGVENPYAQYNGGFVTVLVGAGEDVLNELRIVIENGNITFEVEGLKDFAEFNPFSYLELCRIKYDGVETYKVKYPSDLKYLLGDNDFEVTSAYVDNEEVVYVRLTETAIENLRIQG